jgi:phospholipid-transporting ATPase
MYKLGQRAEFYNHKTFSSWIANCFLHSLLMYNTMKVIYTEAQMLGDGRVATTWLFGQTIYTIDLITITLKAALIVDTWVRFTFIAIFGSIGFWYIAFPAYCYVGPLGRISEELFGLVPPMFGSATVWLAMLIVPIITNMRDFVWK